MTTDRETDRTKQIMRDAAQAVEDAQHSLGQDPARVAQLLQEHPLTTDQLDEAEKLFRQDLVAVENEVAQAAVHVRAQAPAGASALKRGRTMV